MGITLNQLTNSVKKVKEYVEDTVNNKLDIAADFLSDNGFGNARCKSGVFEYYDKDNSVWKSSNNTPSRINISVKPQSMRKFTLAVDLENGGFRLKWLEPQDTIIDGQVVCTVDKVVIRRKKDSAPTSPTDGEEVITVDREQFGKYENKWFLDKSFSPVVGDIWYYKAFPFDDSEVYNNSVVNEKSLKYDTYVIYGFSIDQTESNPDSMIQYIDDCTNTEYEPAKMDFDNKVFDYGSWADAWFIKQCKPCMLKYDGTVDYYLDMNDYSKKRRWY